MDISSKGSYPSKKLSNFTYNNFIFQDIECNSMEGFLQSLKFSNEDVQKNVCLMMGIKAKRHGQKKNWKKEQLLYWKGCSYQRKSKEYYNLIMDAFEAMYLQCESFRKALHFNPDARFTHSIGKNNKSETVLTEQEFCNILHKLKDKL